MTAGDELTLLAEEGGVVDGEEHRHRRLVDGDRRQRFRILHITDRVANLKFLQADDGTDVTTVYLFGAHMSHTIEGMQFLDLRLLHGTVTMSYRHLLAILQRAAVYTSHSDTTRITGVVE